MKKIFVMSTIVSMMLTAGCSSDEARLSYFNTRDQIISHLSQAAQTIQSSNDDVLSAGGCQLLQRQVSPLLRFVPQIEQLKSSVFESTYCAGFDSNNNCTAWITDRIQPGYDKTLEIVAALFVLGGHINHLCSLSPANSGQVIHEAKYVAWFISNETLPRMREYDYLVRRQTRWGSNVP